MRISDWSSDVCSSDLETGRDVSVFVLVMIIAAETDEEAMAKWQLYNDGVDLDAIAWLADQGAKDTVNTDTNVRQLAAPEGAENINMGTRSEEHTSELQSLMRISYAVFCLKKKQHNIKEGKY